MSIIEFLQGFFGERFLGFFLFVTYLGSSAIYLVLLSLYCWLVDLRQGRQLSLLFTLSIMSNLLIKNTLMMPRPYMVNPDVMTVEALQTQGSFSFPSGHAQGAATFWGAIACFQQKVWLWIVAIALIFLVSLSRLYLGVHFPVDVAVGILLGILWITLGLWAGRHATVPQYQLWQKMSVWAVGGLLAIAFPSLKDLMGLFFGVLPMSQTTFESPQNWRDRSLLGIVGLAIVIASDALLQTINLLLPEFAFVDYAQYLAIALIVTEGVPWAWQRWQQVR